MSKDPSYSEVQRLQEDVSLGVFAVIKVKYKSLLNSETVTGSHLVAALLIVLFLSFCLFLISLVPSRR